jgi:hypothetical protein
LTLIAGKSESPIADLLAKNSVFFDEEIDGIPLALIYPNGDGKDQKSKWIQSN